MLAFVDIETTGLDPERHAMWELALIIRTDEGDREHHWQLAVDLSVADPAALRISRFYRRIQCGPDDSVMQMSPVRHSGGAMSIGRLAARVACLCDGATLVGAVPSFDASFIERWLRANGQCPTWHHRLRCVETLAAGYLRRSDLGGLAGCCEALGIKQEGEHTALGDARAARDVWDTVMAAAS